MKKIILLFTCIVCLLTACHSDNAEQSKNSKKTLFTVNAKNNTQVLTYSGSVKPIRTFAIASPTDGVVSKVYFKYGQRVKKGQLLLLITSQALNKDFQSALSNYLTAKNKYENASQNMLGTKHLYQSGIISRDNYTQAVSGLSTAYLQLLQAKEKLNALLQLANINAENFMRLELKNAHAIEKVLENPINKIKIYAATTGIALKPAKQQSNSDSGASSSLDKLALGTSIKKNQSLVSIGDMSGIEIQVNVDQVSINSIKPGQQAIISSSAFPKIKLQGVVSSVTEQAASNNDSNLPTFPVLIQVAKMTQQQQQQIRDGMNAKVSIYIKQKQAIKVPITAVFAKNDQSYVKILNPKTGKLKAIRIETGRTELNTVVVLKGLKSGDKIASRH